MNVKIILLLVIVACTTVAYGSRQISLRNEEPANFCQGCRSVVSFIGQFNSSSNTRADYKSLFRNYCELWYPVSTDFQQGPCPLFVETLYYIMDRVDPVHHCDQIDACGMDASSMFVNKASNSIEQGGVNDIVCDVCEQAIEQLQGQLEDPKVENLIRRQITGLCEYLKVVDADKECKDVLLKHLDDLLQFVRNLDAKKYCQSISLCPAKQQQVKKIPTLADFRGFGVETSVEIGKKPVKDIQLTHYKKGPACTICKMFVKEMFSFIRDNRTEENIEQALDQGCKLIFHRGSSFDRCQEMVEAYAKELIDLLAHETDPELICMLIEMCTYQTESTITTSVSPKPEIVAVAPNMGKFISMLDSSIEEGSMKSCLECKLFIETVRNTFSEPKSKEYIKNWLLENLCASLEEKQLKDSCKALVESYADVFFEAVVSELNPQEACTKLGACTKRKHILLNNNITPIMRHPVKSVITPPKIKSGPFCDQCISTVEQLDSYLSTHSIEHDVSVLIDEVCNKMPSLSMKTGCTSIVKTLGVNIAHAIAAMDDPRQLCSSISLC